MALTWLDEFQRIDVSKMQVDGDPEVKAFPLGLITIESFSFDFSTDAHWLPGMGFIASPITCNMVVVSIPVTLLNSHDLPLDTPVELFTKEKSAKAANAILEKCVINIVCPGDSISVPFGWISVMTPCPMTPTEDNDKKTTTR